jgi:hypothetical protein
MMPPVSTQGAPWWRWRALAWEGSSEAQTSASAAKNRSPVMIIPIGDE